MSGDLRALRMERARLLLERAFLTVKEVMAFVGINDPSHFSRDFSRHHGVAPSACANAAGPRKYGPAAADSRPGTERTAATEPGNPRLC